MIIDAQLHEPSVRLDWDDADRETRSRLLLELQLGSMAAAGVDAAVLFPIAHEWAVDAAAARPETFAVVRMVTPGGALDGLDAGAANIRELVEREARRPGAVGLRIMPSVLPSRGGAGYALLRDGGYERAITACEELGLPLFMTAVGDLDAPAEVARRHPELTLVVDHLGLPQPPSDAPDRPPFGAIDRLLALASLPNVAVKICGVPSLSSEAYPFTDVWPHLRRVVDAFGPDRLMWGSDISRFQRRIGFHTLGSGDLGYPGHHTYAESLHFLRETDRITAAEKAWLLGGTVRRLLRWPR